jgi:diguanylate cyclase (GGDEF)-like protein
VGRTWHLPTAEHERVTLLDRILRYSGVARVAMASLALGLSGLALLAIRSTAPAPAETAQIRATLETKEHWDDVSVHVGRDVEALMSYPGARGSVPRPPLKPQLGSAATDLAWLQHHGDSGETSRARAFGRSYDAYAESLRQLLAADDHGSSDTVQVTAEQALLTASALRGKAADNADQYRTALNLDLEKVAPHRATLHAAAIALGSADLLLLTVCGLIFVGYRRHADRQAEQSTYRAMHDGLTGIPNRTLFVDRLDGAVRQAQQHGTQVALLLLDLDRFKEVNDTLGHQHGDRLLTEVALRLSQAVRVGDTVARIGGDEFAILLEGDASEAAALLVAQRVLEVVCHPVSLDGVTADVGCSIGAAVYPQHGDDQTELLKNADIAMYVAKRGHLGVSVYSFDADQFSSGQLVILGELRYAIDTGELVLFYQPKVVTSTGAVCGVEALVRWQHPTRGLLGPNEFIPAAERSDLILPLTDYVISAALDQVSEWRAGGLRLPVAVNVGAVAFLDSLFPDRVGALLAESGVPADLITLEITETAFISDEESALSVLDRLRLLGVRLSLDDFGTGYSAMAYLQRMPLQELKIDRRFITDLLTSRQNRAITRALIQIAHALDMHVVGEGVEDAATLDALRELGCDQAQGYHLCRPIPAAALTAWLAERSNSLPSQDASTYV